MKFKNSPSFHCHPQSLDSASTPEAFVKKELELESGAITCTDHGTLTAAYKIYDLAKKASITPIIGIEGYLRDDDDPILKKFGIPKNDKGTFADYIKYTHVTLHCLDFVAYQFLSKLVSVRAQTAERHGSESKPIFTWKDLEELGAYNVTAGSGCLIGLTQRHLLDYDSPEIATAYYEKARGCFKPGNFYAEIFPHICDSNWSSGLFLELQGEASQKFHSKKWFKTNLGEIQAKDLLKAWERKDHGEHHTVISIKDSRKWRDMEPKTITSMKYEEGFILNECKPWAPNGDVQAGANQFIIELAKKYGDKIVISDDCHFTTPEDKIVQDVKLMASGGSWRMSSSYHRQSSADSFGYFNNRMGVSESEFEGWVNNNIEWSSRFKDFKFETQVSLPAKFFPEDGLKYLKELIAKQGRMDWTDKVMVDRLKKEIRLFHQNEAVDLLTYFFTVEDSCSYYESLGELMGPGRGSAAGVLLSYVLGITHLSPLEFDLSLDRFMTDDRIKSGKYPDIDMDFSNRDLLVDFEDGYLKKRYGNHVAQISTDNLLKLRSSAKDIARVKFGGRVPYEIEQLVEKFKKPPQGINDKDFVLGYEGDGGWEPGSIEFDPALQEYKKRYPEDFQTLLKCLGVTRSRGRHASGYIISNEPIQDLMPTEVINGVTCTQYTAASVEAVGGIKFDYLTVNALKDISDCIKLIQQRSGTEVPANVTLNNRRVPKLRVVVHNGQLFDVWELHDNPFSKPVYATIASGDTSTVFQLNTGGAAKWLNAFDQKRPNGEPILNSIDQVAVFTALDRPGPLNAFMKDANGNKTHNMLVEYANRVAGKPHGSGLEAFEGLIPETEDILCYQESVQKIYQQFTGCTGAEAESFRGDIAKKKKEKIVKIYPQFIEQVGKKVGPERARQIWDSIFSFSDYGFCKAHAYSYALVGFACAYFKHHFSLEWWTAVLSNADKNEINDTFWIYSGHLIDLPDINKSKSVFSITGERIQAPIDLLKGIGDLAHQQVCQYRPYADIHDFCRKIHQHKLAGKTVVIKDNISKVKLGHSAINRAIVYKLIISGSMDSLFPVTSQSEGPEYTLGVVDRLRLFENAFAETQEEVLPRYGKKGNILKEPPKKVDPRYAEINEMTKYQLRKEILPAYSKDITHLLHEKGVAGVIKRGDGYVFKREEVDPIEYPFVNFIGYNVLDTMDPFPVDHGGIKVAVSAYVETTRKFKYQNNTKEACEFVLDIGGGKCNTVKWPGKNGKLGAAFDSIKDKSIVIVILDKWSEDRPFAIKDIIPVYDPLDIDHKGDLQ